MEGNLMRLYDLRTDHRRDNILVGSRRPVFSWKIDDGKGSAAGVYQRAYRVRVFEVRDNAEDILRWDSGTVRSNRQCEISYEGEPLGSDCRYVWSVDCSLTYRIEEDTSEREQTISGESRFETALYERSDWKGVFIGETRDREYHLYRRRFAAEGRIRRAKLYVCALGAFEAWMNGVPVTDAVLEPGWSDYRKTCFYTAYDVTALLQDSANTFLIKLGDGMFNVPGGRYVYYTRSYGRAKLLCQLEIVYEDGRTQRVVSDEAWEMADSPIRFCCIYGGEDYDARLFPGEYLTGEDPGDAFRPVNIAEDPQGELRPMPMESVRVKKTYAPVSVREAAPGILQFDFGVNCSGRVRIVLRTDGKSAGHPVVMKPAEKLGPDGRIDQRGTGEGYAWTYIPDGRKVQEFVPDFTYTGFRYVEVTGAVPVSDAGGGDDAAAQDFPRILRIQSEFLYTDAEPAGEFGCSKTLFCQIHGIVLQAIRSNTKSYFTDCPHREKLGWLEQTHLVGPSIMYNLEVHSLYAKVVRDMVDSQHEDGLVPDICPEYVTGFEKWHEGFLDSPEWGSACIISPWYVYRRYGDERLLAYAYPSMKRYLSYLTSRTHHEILHHGLGDWLDVGPCRPHSQNTPVPVTATCIYYLDLTLMEQMAILLGGREKDDRKAAEYAEDAAGFAQRKKAVFAEYNAQFLDTQTGRYANGSQTAQAMSLVCGLVPDRYRERAAAQLRQDIEKRGYAVTGGDVGHPFLVAALMEYDMTDLLNRMTEITDRPGYGYQVVNGATALTEEWDGPEPGNLHGSQNHLMLGSIEEWFYAGLGGVDLVRSNLPLNEVRIRPRPEEGVDWVRVRVMHPYGEIRSEWKRENGRIDAVCRIPPNLTAHLCLPDGTELRTVGSGTHTFRIG